LYNVFRLHGQFRDQTSEEKRFSAISRQACAGNLPQKHVFVYKRDLCILLMPNIVRPAGRDSHNKQTIKALQKRSSAGLPQKEEACGTLFCKCLTDSVLRKRLPQACPMMVIESPEAWVKHLQQVPKNRKISPSLFSFKKHKRFLGKNA